MQKRARKCNLECISHVTLSRKSLLACTLLGMLAGNQAMADVTIEGEAPYVGATQIGIDDLDGNETTINAGAIELIDSDANFISITPGSGIVVIGPAGETFITSDGSQLHGDLLVEGDVEATTITASLNAAGEKITNVAAGTAGSDAVNYDQLRAVQNSYNSQYDELASQTNARFNAVDRRIDKVEEVANAGVASVAALAAIPAPAYGKRFSVGAGLGNYSSESAVAVGFRAAITESTSVTAGVSRNTASKTAANLGVGYSW